MDEKDFQLIIEKSKNPYGSGYASKKIVKIIKDLSLHNIIKKSFYNIRL